MHAGLSVSSKEMWTFGRSSLRYSERGHCLHTWERERPCCWQWKFNHVLADGQQCTAISRPVCGVKNKLEIIFFRWSRSTIFILSLSPLWTIMDKSDYSEVKELITSSSSNCPTATNSPFDGDFYGSAKDDSFQSTVWNDSHSHSSKGVMKERCMPVCLFTIDFHWHESRQLLETDQNTNLLNIFRSPGWSSPKLQKNWSGQCKQARLER